MKNHLLLLSFLTLTATLFGQTATDPEIRKELTDWDPVRGPWLAESLQAMANNQTVPDRTFPEQFTPAEMYSQVPADRQNIIRGRVERNRQNSSSLDRTSWDRMSGYVNRPSCNLVMGRTYGDPHIKTFDGKTFSFQTVGEFVLAKSGDGNLEVQARQKAQSDDISLNTALAMNVSGDRIAIYAMDAPDGNNEAPLRVNGQTIFLQDEMYYLPRGGTIEDKGKTYIVTWPTGEKVEAKMTSSGRMKFFNISVNVYPCNNMYMGVLGNANGNPNDDFGDRSGMLASSTIFDPFGTRPISRNNSNLEKEQLAYLAKDFARYHRVTSSTTLFDYGFGQSTWSFTDESFPRVHLTLADMSEIDRNNAQRRCEQQGIFPEDMAGCIFDIGHAKIEPTPRPVLNDRTAGGRPLPQVDGRTPNVNRKTIGTGTRETIERQKTIESNPISPVPSKPIVVGGTDKEMKKVPQTDAPIAKPSGNEGEIDGNSKHNTAEPVFKPSGSTVGKEPSKPVLVPVNGPTFNQNPAKPVPVKDTSTDRKTTNPGSIRTTAPVSEPVVKPSGNKAREDFKQTPVFTPQSKPIGKSVETNKSIPTSSPASRGGSFGGDQRRR